MLHCLSKSPGTVCLKVQLHCAQRVPWLTKATQSRAVVFPLFLIGEKQKKERHFVVKEVAVERREEGLVMAQQNNKTVKT